MPRFCSENNAPFRVRRSRTPAASKKRFPAADTPDQTSTVGQPQGRAAPCPPPAEGPAVLGKLSMGCVRRRCLGRDSLRPVIVSARTDCAPRPRPRPASPTRFESRPRLAAAMLAVEASGRLRPPAVPPPRVLLPPVPASVLAGGSSSYCRAVTMLMRMPEESTYGLPVATTSCPPAPQRSRPHNTKSSAKTTWYYDANASS